MKFDSDIIKAILKHREPFLFLDSIEDISDDTIEASLKISGCEFFLRGHFPNDPVMPGVLLIESIAQAAGFLVVYNLTKKRGGSLGNLEYDSFLSKVNYVKFKAKVIPPAVLCVKAKIIPAVIENFYETTGQIYVSNELKVVSSLLSYVKIKN